MKTAAFLIGLGAIVVSISFGAERLGAAQSTVLDFCPDKPGHTDCSTAATMFVGVGHPTDDQIVGTIDAILAARKASDDCRDTQTALTTLAGAIRNAATRALAQQSAGLLCHASLFGLAENASPSIPADPPHSGGSGRSSNRGGSSGTSGTSSGVSSSGTGASSGTSSGTSGDQSSSGAGTNSGTSGQSSSGAGTPSSGTNGCENADCGGGTPDV